MEKILVVIVTYNALKWAEQCLNSLRLSSLKVDVFVVDNGSTDGTQTYIQEKHPEAIFFQSEGNLGFGRGNNIGLEYALKHGYDYVYLLNQDAWLYQDTLELLVCTHKKHPEYGIISPLQCQANEKNLDAHFIRCITNYGKNLQLLGDSMLGIMRDVYEVPFVMAAHWLISKECLLSVGGFSPTFSHYGEDGNFIHRATYTGFKVGICPMAKAIHDREERPFVLKKHLWVLKMGMFATFSNPNLNFAQSLKHYIRQVARNFLRYPSVLHFSNLFSLISNYKIIKRNKLICINTETPFLNYGDKDKNVS